MSSNAESIFYISSQSSDVNESKNTKISSLVNEDLSDCALKIECPTLLIWGTNDTEAPIEEARELEKLLKQEEIKSMEFHQKRLQN